MDPSTPSTCEQHRHRARAVGDQEQRGRAVACGQLSDAVRGLRNQPVVRMTHSLVNTDVVLWVRLRRAPHHAHRGSGRSCRWTWSRSGSSRLASSTRTPRSMLRPLQGRLPQQVRQTKKPCLPGGGFVRSVFEPVHARRSADEPHTRPGSRSVVHDEYRSVACAGLAAEERPVAPPARRTSGMRPVRIRPTPRISTRPTPKILAPAAVFRVTPHRAE